MPERDTNYRQWLRRVARRLPYLGGVLRERDQLRTETETLRAGLTANAEPLWVPAGHFYSPLPSLAEVRRDEFRIFEESRCLPGVDMRDADQVALLEQLATYYATAPFPEHRTNKYRYFYENGAYSYADAIFLHCMIRYLQPKRVIEVGSGHSSCVTLDTNDLFFRSAIRCTFIEPYPETLLSLLHPGDRERIDLRTERLQDVAPALFEELGKDDILFIDSTHVSKTGSDVNLNFFDLLPRLAEGVYVHIHDIFYPFEYPAYWVYEGRAWNEAYLLHAFLQYNDSFQVVIHTDYLAKFHKEKLLALMPACMKNTGGSIWLKRVKS